MCELMPSDGNEVLLTTALRGLKESMAYPFLAALGGTTLLYYGGKTICQLLNGIRVHFWSKLRVVNLKETFGKWAIVTGCTNGIGRAMCIELASRGLNIVLIARNSTHLNELSAHLVSKYNIETLNIIADFKDTGIYEDIREQIQPVQNNLGILINNVAMAPEEPDFFEKASETSLLDSIHTNVASVSLMSKIALESMVKRRRGAIVNVSSFAGAYAAPLITIYSATKAFVNHFSRNLALEAGPKGICVQNLVPLGVKTNMLRRVWDNNSVRSPLTPCPEVYAYNALNTLGRTSQTSGYWRHSLVQWFARSAVPSSFVDRQMYGIMRHCMHQKNISAGTQASTSKKSK